MPLRSVNRHRQSSSRVNDTPRFRHRPYAFDMSSVVPLRSSSCQSPDLVLPRPFPSVLTTMAFDHSRRRWFGTCSCQPVPRGRPSSIKQLHTLDPPRPFALVAHDRRRSEPQSCRLARFSLAIPRPKGRIHSAGTRLPAAVKPLHLAVSLPSSPTTRRLPKHPPLTISGSDAAFGCWPLDA